MSEPIPESVPVSADPRSQRPTKKRQLNAPASALAASQISALFARPEQEIRTATVSSTHPSASGHAPPEIVQNVQGSSAGAGSGEFHVYKASRRREYERLRRMDAENRAELERDDFERRRAEREDRDAERTRRNREKRARKRKVKDGSGTSGNGDAQARGGGSGRDVDGEEDDGYQSPQPGSHGVKGGIKRRPTAQPRTHAETETSTSMARQRETSDRQAGPVAEEPVGLIIHDDD